MHPRPRSPHPSSRSRGWLRGLTALALACGLAAVGASPSGAAGVRAGSAPAADGPLPLGAPPHVPWIRGHTLYDGNRSVALDFAYPEELQRAYEGWFVAGNDAGSSSVVRVKPDGEVLPLQRRMDSWAASPDRRRVAAVQHGAAPRDLVTVYRATDGTTVGSRRWTRPVVHAVHTRGVLLTIHPPGLRPRVIWWNAREDTVHRVTYGEAVRAEPRVDRLVMAGRDGSACGGRVVSLSHPGTVIRALRGLQPLSWNSIGDSALLTDCSTPDPWLRTVEVRTDPAWQGLSRTTTRSSGQRFQTPVWEGQRTWISVRWDADYARLVRCDRRARVCEKATRNWPTRTDPFDGSLVEPALVVGTR